jgi:hypothetical protein
MSFQTRRFNRHNTWIWYGVARVSNGLISMSVFDILLIPIFGALHPLEPPPPQATSLHGEIGTWRNWVVSSLLYHRRKIHPLATELKLDVMFCIDALRKRSFFTLSGIDPRRTPSTVTVSSREGRMLRSRHHGSAEFVASSIVFCKIMPAKCPAGMWPVLHATWRRVFRGRVWVGYGWHSGGNLKLHITS